MPGLGTLTVYLNANSTGLERGISKAMGMLKTMAATAAAYAGVNAVKDLVSESLTLMSVQEQSEKALSRTLAASNKKINGTAGQLKQWAADMQSLTTFGDEKLIQAQTRLLEMNSVEGKAFDAARTVALDLAAQSGEDVTAVMQKLGMAMQDPIKAFKQLRQYGVDTSMREEVEKRLAAGDKEAAQLMILTDLQKRFAGAAEEAADTYTGRLTQVQNAVGDLKEAIGYVIEEIFGVKDGLKSSAETIGEWASALRMRAREIGFAFRSVWTDIQAGVNALWVAIKPVIDQISAVVEAAIRNIRALFSGSTDFVTPDYSIFAREMSEMNSNFAKIEDERQRVQDQLFKQLADKEDRARKEDAAKSAGSLKKAVEEGTIAADKAIKTGAVSAELGSADAWKIITADALTGKASGSTPAASALSAVSASPASSPRDIYLDGLRAQAKNLAADAKFSWTMPAAPQRKDTSQILADGTWEPPRIWKESAWWEKPVIAAELASQALGTQKANRIINALQFTPLGFQATAAQALINPRAAYDRVRDNFPTAADYGQKAITWLGDKLGDLFEKNTRELSEIRRNTAKSVPNPANLRSR